MKNQSVRGRFSVSIIGIASFILCCSQFCSAQNGTAGRKGGVEEEIWSSESAYFTNLYKADYEGVLFLTDEQFLGWPDGLQKPIGKEESAKFMKQLIPRPSPCKFTIEREGIRVMGEAALTQYKIYVNCKDSTGMISTTSSRITHTWIKRGDSWKLLGGMSSK